MSLNYSNCYIIPFNSSITLISLLPAYSNLHLWFTPLHMAKAWAYYFLPRQANWIHHSHGCTSYSSSVLCKLLWFSTIKLKTYGPWRVRWRTPITQKQCSSLILIRFFDYLAFLMIIKWSLFVIVMHYLTSGDAISTSTKNELLPITTKNLKKQWAITNDTSNCARGPNLCKQWSDFIGGHLIKCYVLNPLQ